MAAVASFFFLQNVDVIRALCGSRQAKADGEKDGVGSGSGGSSGLAGQVEKALAKLDGEQTDLMEGGGSAEDYGGSSPAPSPRQQGPGAADAHRLRRVNAGPKQELLNRLALG